MKSKKKKTSSSAPKSPKNLVENSKGFTPKTKKPHKG